MNQNEKIAAVRESVFSTDIGQAGRLIVEAMLDDEVSVGDIAADFIENEVGHYDWMTNWKMVKSKENPVVRVQNYLDRYGLVADAQAVVDSIDHMAADNPGRWK